MKRTANRPLVTGELEPSSALVFAVVLEILALSATLFYVFVYTLWLKRTSSHNIVIGGAAGAMPVLVGWSAVTGHLALAPLVLFALIFVWTPPHFWALAIKYRDDYAAADVPMLPVVESLERTTARIMTYSVLVGVASLVFAAVAAMGPLYVVSAIVLGVGFLVCARRVQQDPTVARAMGLFGYSITYLTLLFAAMAMDALIRRGV